MKGNYDTCEETSQRRNSTTHFRSMCAGECAASYYLYTPVPGIPCISEAGKGQNLARRIRFSGKVSFSHRPQTKHEMFTAAIQKNADHAHLYFLLPIWCRRQRLRENAFAAQLSRMYAIRVQHVVCHFEPKFRNNYNQQPSHWPRPLAA